MPLGDAVRSAEVPSAISAQPVTLRRIVTSRTPDGRTMLFHAKWRAEFDVPTEPKID
jgi:hypothetical protein